ncbi:MAG TPA: SAM-dependent methyltransferase [Gammaproteobacteria bacterium]|nr:SAM-dependent methyltransferase [Gammaproteobacteria bacterium]
MCPKRITSSRQWLREHFSDPYVKQAQKSGYRSRAVYKLQELHDRDRLFQPGMTVIDLGAAPGGWAQLLRKLLGKKGRIIALDLLPIEPLPGVEFILGDFTELAIQHKVLEAVDGAQVDWIISDMAANFSGIASVDQLRSINLLEAVLEFALKILPEGGGILIKAFQGEGFEDFLKAVKNCFKKVLIRKPKASRERSPEIYIVARGRK